MRLIIAEKPTIARALAGVMGGQMKGDGCINCANDTVITWAFGHLLGFDTPESYAGGRIDISALPIIPDNMMKIARDGDAGKQLKIIVNLIKKAKLIVNAGDSDREGQLLIDEIIEYAGYNGPVDRIWLSAVDPDSLKKALSSIRPNAEFANLSASAQCRSTADWLVGFNGSIALSRRIQQAGGSGKFSVGRVQTPTLALIVDRELEMTSFTKRLHYTVAAIIMPGQIKAGWKMPDDLDGLSEDGLLLDKNIADTTSARITGKPALLTAYEVKTVFNSAPLPHSLSSLQKAASSKGGLSAKATLAAVQSLYEAGILTYPRTDARYIPTEQHQDAHKILAALRDAGTPGAGDADAGLKHAAFDTEKMKELKLAHHAIIPTTTPLTPGSTSDQRVVYSLVATAYIRLFYPPEKFETRAAAFDIDGLTFTAKSRTSLEPGWTRLGGSDSDEDDQADGGGSRLPDMSKGERLTCDRGEIDAKETKPPRALNDGSLIGAMTSIHKLVDDPKLKSRLKETSGLGTEATRAGIIETLIDRGYAARKGKEIRATREGIDLIKTIRSVYPLVANAGVTAVWEDSLADVASGKLAPDKFLAAQHDAVRKMTAAIVNAASIGSLAPKPSGHKCPDCGADLVAKKTKSGLDILVCSGQCGAAFFKEKDGKPGQKLGTAREPDSAGPPCPTCKNPTGQFKTQSQGAIYYKCAGGHGVWWDDKGNLGKKWDDKPAQKSGATKSAGRR